MPIKNIPLPFKQGLHLEIKYPHLEIGLYNWKTCRYSVLFKMDELRRKDGLFHCVSVLGLIRYFRGIHSFTIYDLAGETDKLRG